MQVIVEGRVVLADASRVVGAKVEDSRIVVFIADCPFPIPLNTPYSESVWKALNAVIKRPSN